MFSAIWQHSWLQRYCPSQKPLASSPDVNWFSSLGFSNSRVFVIVSTYKVSCHLRIVFLISYAGWICARDLMSALSNIVPCAVQHPNCIYVIILTRYNVWFEQRTMNRLVFTEFWLIEGLVAHFSLIPQQAKIAWRI